MPRHTYWVDNAQEGLTIASGAQATQRLGSSDANFITERMATVIRTIWNLDINSTTVAGAFGTQVVSYGIGVESLEAFNAGTHPDPESDSEFPTRGWIMRGQCTVFQNGVGTQIVTRCGGDIRSARKIDNGVLFLIIDNSPQVGTAFSCTFSGLIRCLIKGG